MNSTLHSTLCILSTVISFHPPVPGAIAVVGELYTYGEDDNDDRDSPADDCVFEAHVTVNVVTSQTAEIKTKSFKHHPRKAGHEEEVHQNRHHLAQHLQYGRNNVAMQ